MGQNTPNIGLYEPAVGEFDYSAPFDLGMTYLDNHDHSGPPHGGVQIGTSGIADHSITGIKLNANCAGVGLTYNTSTNALDVNFASDGQTIAGSSTILAVNPHGLNAKLGSQTQYGVPIGGGATGALSWSAAPTNGQFLIGATSSTPVLGTVTSNDNTVTVTLGAGTIDLSTATASGTVTTIDGNTGSAAPVAGVISVVGDTSTGVSTNGAASTLTITNAIANNATTIAGSATNQLVVPAGLSAKLGTQTLHALPIGAGATNAVSWTAVPTNGQLLIGSTGANPVLANLTSLDSSVTITNSAGGIDLSASGGTGVVKFLHGNSGGDVGPNVSGVVNLISSDMVIQSSGPSQLRFSITGPRAAHGTIATTDATPTTLHTIAVSNNTTVTITGSVVGMKSDFSAACGGDFEGVFRKPGAGAVVAVGSPVVNVQEDSAGAPTFTVAASGSNIIVQVSGVIAETWNWSTYVSYITQT